MSLFSRRSWTDELQDNVGHHLAALRREVQSLSRDAGKYGRGLQHDAGDLGEALAAQGAQMARQLGRQARRAGEAVRQDPVPAMVSLVAVACLASLLLGGKSRAKR